jgi:hypothetical protein
VELLPDKKVLGDNVATFMKEIGRTDFPDQPER